MNPVKITDNVYWVGGIDWNLRNFHGYLTQRGSTYNAYLIIDEKITLIDTVKHYHAEELIERISQIVDPSKIDYIVANHVEMDHSGALPDIMKLAPNAKILTSPQGKKGLTAHYRSDWDYEVVKSGDVVNIGKRNLNFVLTPMVHWPDNMVCYVPEDKILFSNDAFGQHIATSARFDDESHLDIIKEEAKKYYANIVLPYSDNVKGALAATADLDIEIIAPSHGIVWRSHIDQIIKLYENWSDNKTDKKALIIYDTMWKSTELIAYAIQKGFDNKGIRTHLFNLQFTHISDIMTHVLNAEYICVGSPTLNKNMLPTVAGFLSYFKGLAPKGRTGLAFGSYGWAGKSVEEVHDALDSCKFNMMEKIKVNYIPDKETLDAITKQIEEAIG